MTEQELIIYEKIQNYVAGTLSVDEKKVFEQEIQKDEKLAQTLELYKELIPVIAHDKKKELDLRDTLNTIHSESTKPENSPKVFNLKRILSIAASLVILFGLFKFASLGGNTNNLDAFYTYDSISLVSKSSQDATFSQLEKAFNAHNYEASLPLAKQVLNGYPEDKKALLVKGISEMETGSYTQALESFKQLKSANLRIEKSDWFIALTYLKMDNKTAAKETLTTLIKEEGYNHVKAKELLQILK